MSRYWIVGVVALIAACGGGAATTPAVDSTTPAETESSAGASAGGPRSIAGTYAVLAGGGWARGEATISRKGAAFEVVWTYSAEKSVRGVGVRNGDHFGIGYDTEAGDGVVAVAVYRLDGSELRGTWATSAGGERLGEEEGSLTGGAFEGSHAVTGTDMSGAPYRARLHVRAVGDGYRMWMMKGDERTRDGVALRSGDVVVWAWGDGSKIGVADYRIAADADALAGRWARWLEYAARWETLSRRPGARDPFDAPDGGPSEEELAVYAGYQRELAAIGHALRAANQAHRNDCKVSADTVRELLDSAGAEQMERLRAARAVMDRHPRHKWSDVPAADERTRAGLRSYEDATIRCIVSKEFDSAEVAIDRASLDEDQLRWLERESVLRCYDERIADPAKREAAADAFLAAQDVTRVEHDVARPAMMRSDALERVLDAADASCESRKLP